MDLRRYLLGIVVLGGLSAQASNSYRIQPPDYTLAEFPYLLKNKWTQPIVWIKGGPQGGARRTPPNWAFYNAEDRSRAAGWRAFQFYIALHGLPVREDRWIPNDTPYNFSRETAIAQVTDRYLGAPGVNSAQMARDLAVKEVNAHYHFEPRMHHQLMRPSANAGMVACWRKQTAAIEMFVQRFAGSPLHDEFMRKANGNIQPWINVQHVLIPGAGVYGDDKVSFNKAGTITIVPRGVDAGAKCATASATQIWNVVERAIRLRLAGEAFPDEGLPADVAAPAFGQKILMGSRAYASEEHKRACIILDYYHYYKRWFDLHPREYRAFYNTKYKKYVVSFVNAHPEYKDRLYGTCH